MIRFIKMLPYPLFPESGDVFAYLDRVTTQSIDPPSLNPQQLYLEEPFVFHSPLRRVSECLSLNHAQQRIPLKELREIPFSLQSLCTREEWLLEHSVIVRRRFKEAFIADRLLISRADLLNEIKKIEELILRSISMAIVSHSFRLKLIEVYFATQGQIFRQPELIHDWIFEDKKTYNWGEGFMIESPICPPKKLN